MKFSHFSIGLLALFSPLAAAWSKEDREIFRIRDEIAAHEVDASSTFYDILGISTSANQDDINKAFRKLTRSLHPDKIKQQLKTERDKRAKKAGTDKPPKPLTQKAIKAAVKDASERQARLSLIANILRGSGRDRYDHYLKNGFPLWKGTDYLYNRYRPGFGTALIGSFILCGGAIHYLILYMGWKRQKEFVERYVNFAKDKAWGGSGSPGVPGVDLPPAPPPVATDQDDEGGPPQALNRRQRRMQDRETKKDDGRGRVKKIKKDSKSQSASREGSTGPTGARKRVVAENGKVLVVDSLGDVYLEEQDKEGNVNEYLLDPNELAKPTIQDTALVRIPLWAFNSTVGRFTANTQSKSSDDVEDNEDSDEGSAQHTPGTDSAGDDFELLEKSTDSLGKGKTTGISQAGKTGKRKGRKK